VVFHLFHFFSHQIWNFCLFRNNPRRSFNDYHSLKNLYSIFSNKFFSFCYEDIFQALIDSKNAGNIQVEQFSRKRRYSVSEPTYRVDFRYKFKILFLPGKRQKPEKSFIWTMMRRPIKRIYRCQPWEDICSYKINFWSNSDEVCNNCPLLPFSWPRRRRPFFHSTKNPFL